MWWYWCWVGTALPIVQRLWEHSRYQMDLEHFPGHPGLPVIMGREDEASFRG